MYINIFTHQAHQEEGKTLGSNKCRVTKMNKKTEPRKKKLQRQFCVEPSSFARGQQECNDRRCIFLHCCRLIPLCCLVVILFNTLTGVVHVVKVEPRICIPLLVRFR